MKECLPKTNPPIQGIYLLNGSLRTFRLSNGDLNRILETTLFCLFHHVAFPFVIVYVDCVGTFLHIGYEIKDRGIIFFKIHIRMDDFRLLFDGKSFCCCCCRYCCLCVCWKIDSIGAYYLFVIYRWDLKIIIYQFYPCYKDFNIRYSILFRIFVLTRLRFF